MISTEAGMEIDFRHEHWLNPKPSIRLSREFCSNVTVSREEQELKPPEEMISIEAGIEIDGSDEQWRNAKPSIRLSRESCSNVTVLSEVQE
jgi:hypothetical protein